MLTNRFFCFLATLIISISTAHAQSDCGIIYGNHWAFTFSTPDKWTSLCQAERLVGAPVAFWPEGSTFADSTAVMYVNVAKKEKPTLAAFVRSSQRLFRKQAPNVVFVPIQQIATKPDIKAMHFSASGDPGGNVEQLAYVEGPTAYFILVLSARTSDDLKQAKPAFHALLQSFAPMAAKVQP